MLTIVCICASICAGVCTCIFSGWMSKNDSLVFSLLVHGRGLCPCVVQTNQLSLLTNNCICACIRASVCTCIFSGWMSKNDSLIFSLLAPGRGLCPCVVPNNQLSMLIKFCICASICVDVCICILRGGIH